MLCTSHRCPQKGEHYWGRGRARHEVLSKDCGSHRLLADRGFLFLLRFRSLTQSLNRLFILCTKCELKSLDKTAHRGPGPLLPRGAFPMLTQQPALGRQLSSGSENQLWFYRHSAVSPSEGGACSTKAQTWSLKTNFLDSGTTNCLQWWWLLQSWNSCLDSRSHHVKEWLQWHPESCTTLWSGWRAGCTGQALLVLCGAEMEAGDWAQFALHLWAI